jgi:CheY-like chemotaxis protein
MKFLIADDEPEIAEVIDFFLKENFPDNIETFLVDNALDAKAILREHQVDFCISDHNMPEGNGNTILEYIVSSKLKTSFVACSVLTEKLLPAEYPKEHIFFVIVKPKIINGLISLVDLIKESSSKN